MSEAGPGLFDAVLARGGAREATTDEAWLQAMLDAEAALARACASVGLARDSDAARVGECCRASYFDITALGEAAASGGNPVLPLVAALRERVGPPASDLVHRGATSQDILDTAAMVVARRALDAIAADLIAAERHAAGLARAYRDTPMAGRTLMQQAVPTTFGLVAAQWLAGLSAAAGELRRVRDERLAAQLGGAAGTLASYGPDGVKVLERFATEMGLVVPAAPWHSERSRIGELAGALGTAAGVVGSVALDVVVLAQTEVGELSESGDAGRGGSSAMPHKQNPVAAIAARAAAIQAPGLVATLLAAIPQELQRAAGAWHAEWRSLSELLRVTGSGAAWLADCLGRLRVDTERMRANLEMTNGLIHADRVVAALAPALGRQAADALVTELSGAPSFADALRHDRRVTDVLDPGALASLLDPAAAIGAAPALVDRILATTVAANAQAT
jgi:3-carboxy-cis,cis-muconate cycloisomerase